MGGGKVSLAIMAGGESSRMGSDKACLGFGDGTLLEWMLDFYAPLFANVFVVCREPGRLPDVDVPIVRDAVDLRGALVAIYTALLASPTDRVLCLACDMPFVTGALLTRMAQLSEGYGVCVPRHDSLLEPLCAVYARTLAPAAAELLAAGRRRIAPLFAPETTRFLDMKEQGLGDPDLLFANLNTPEELTAARARLAHSRLPVRVRSFMQRVPVPVVSFVGSKNSGKTTLLEAVIRELAARGLRVAAIKHDFHGFEADTPGTDSYRLRRAGAVLTIVSSTEKYATVVMTGEERSLEELVVRLGEDVDIVLAEGFKRQAAPKIEVTRKEDVGGLVAPPEELMALVSEAPVDGIDVSRYSPDDARGVADLLHEWLMGGAAAW